MDEFELDVVPHAGAFITLIGYLKYLDDINEIWRAMPGRESKQRIVKFDLVPVTFYFEPYKGS